MVTPTPGPTYPLAAMKPEARALTIGLAFAWEHAGPRALVLSEESLLWLLDFGAAVLAIDNTVDCMTLGDLPKLARLRMEEFLDVAARTCPRVLEDIARAA